VERKSLKLYVIRWTTPASR